MKNGTIWKDVDGNAIQAHGGCIIKHEGVYYWYGEHKGKPNREGKTEVDAIGVSCYSSKNLVDWKYEGLILEAVQEDSKSPLHISTIMERPKVVYNKKNNNFVLMYHADPYGRRPNWGIGIAVGDTPNGKFQFLKVVRPQGFDSRDMTVYVDDDKAYLFHSSHSNWTLVISYLNEDYTDFTGEYKEILIDQQREAPAIFKGEDRYYMFSSGCTGWYPNACLYAEADKIFGRWKLIDNPCIGENAKTTYGGQSAYVLEAGGKFFLMIDHWHPHNLQESGYSFLPITINPDKTLTVTWQEEWQGI